jgi:hypothetical protein
MKTGISAGVCAMALLPAIAGAQPPAPSIGHPSNRDGLNEQLGEVLARIDRRQARGELSAEDAKHARLEVTDLQSQITEAQSRDGGRLSESDRFDLQGEIHQLEDKIDHERAPGAPPQP